MVELYESVIFSFGAKVPPRKHKKWSGWQELNLRGHVPKTCGWPLPYTRIMGEGLSALSCLPLHTHHLAQRVHYVHQITLRFHHRVDGLVRHRRFVDYIGVLTALDARRRLGMVLQSEAALGLGTRHGTSGSMTTAHKAFRIAFTAYDVRTRPHAAGNNSHVAFTRTYCALARDEHVLAIVVLPSHVVVMAAHDFNILFERWDFSRAMHCRDQVTHHQLAVGQRVVLRPVHCADVVLEVLRALRQVCEVLVRQVDHPLAHVVLCQLDEEGAEAIAHAARSRVQQEPDVLVLIEADFDEMVPRSKRPEVIDALNMVQLRILVDDRLIQMLHLRPHSRVMRRGIQPSAAIVLATVVGTSVRHRFLNRRADAVQIVRQMVRVQRSLHGHHAAANVHTDRRRNDRTASWNYAANGRANAPMHVRHGRYPLVDERQLRDVQKL